MKCTAAQFKIGRIYQYVGAYEQNDDDPGFLIIAKVVDYEKRFMFLVRKELRNGIIYYNNESQRWHRCLNDECFVEISHE
jgi:hypothetical protein